MLQNKTDQALSIVHKKLKNTGRSAVILEKNSNYDKRYKIFILINKSKQTSYQKVIDFRSGT